MFPTISSSTAPQVLWQVNPSYIWYSCGWLPSYHQLHAGAAAQECGKHRPSQELTESLRTPHLPPPVGQELGRSHAVQGGRQGEGYGKGLDKGREG